MLITQFGTTNDDSKDNDTDGGNDNAREAKDADQKSLFWFMVLVPLIVVILNCIIAILNRESDLANKQESKYQQMYINQQKRVNEYNRTMNKLKIKQLSLPLACADEREKILQRMEELQDAYDDWKPAIDNHINNCKDPEKENWFKKQDIQDLRRSLEEKIAEADDTLTNIV